MLMFSEENESLIVINPVYMQYMLTVSCCDSGGGILGVVSFSSRCKMSGGLGLKLKNKKITINITADS